MGFSLTEKPRCLVWVMTCAPGRSALTAPLMESGFRLLFIVTVALGLGP